MTPFESIRPETVSVPRLVQLPVWIAARCGLSGDIREVWRTACPRRPLWEHAVDRDPVEIRRDDAPGRRGSEMRPLHAGHDLLDAHGD